MKTSLYFRIKFKKRAILHKLKSCLHRIKEQPNIKITQNKILNNKNRKTNKAKLKKQKRNKQKCLLKFRKEFSISKLPAPKM